MTVASQVRPDIYPARLYSPLRRRLADCPQRSASPAQWAGLVNNLQKNGVSAAEIAWSGIHDFLVSRNDRRLGLDQLISALDDRPPCELQIERRVIDTYRPNVSFQKQARPFELPDPTICDGRREIDVPNLIAHVRTTERTLASGERILVIEEVQSDWNQALRDAERAQLGAAPRDEDLLHAAFAEDIPPDNPYRNNRWVDASLRLVMLLAVEQGFDAIAWVPGELQADRYQAPCNGGLARFYDEIVATAAGRLAGSWGAPLSVFSIMTKTRSLSIHYLGLHQGWEVRDRISETVLAPPFARRQDAQQFCDQNEGPCKEIVHGFRMTEVMRSDVCAHGLPCLGSIGQRTCMKETSRP